MNTRNHLLNAVLLGVAVGVAITPTPVQSPVLAAQNAAIVTVPAVLGALVPDVDCHVGRHRKTLHNVFVLAGLVAFTLLTGNLRWVWLGYVAHLVLDVVGSRRGVALAYPLTSRELSIPGGVSTDSEHAALATLAVTGVEVLAVAVATGALATPLA